MGSITCTDLAEFGLPLITPGQPEFRSLVHDIESRPQPFGSWPVDDLTKSAVLSFAKNMSDLEALLGQSISERGESG